MVFSPAPGASRLLSLSGAALLGLLLSGCAGSGANVPGLTTSDSAKGRAGPADSTEGASSCGGALANFERVINSDVEVGHLNRSVYGRVVADLAPVKASCAAGKDAQARAQLAAVRARYGYP